MKSKYEYELEFDRCFKPEFGRHLLAEQVRINHPCFEKALKDRSKYCKALEDKYHEEVFIINTIERQIDYKNVNPASMKLFLLQCLGSNNIDQICKRWKSVLSGIPKAEIQVDMAKAYIEGSDIIQGCKNLIKEDYESFLNTVSTKCNHSTVTHDPRRPGSPTEYVFGKDVANWLRNEARSLWSGKDPNNIVN